MKIKQVEELVGITRKNIRFYEEQGLSLIHIFIPFVPAYQAMLGKVEQIIELPETKEHQNRNISTQFFSCFDEIMVKKMEAVLDKDRYIPQEILNTADF